jgi:hypothetical protein
MKTDATLAATLEQLNVHFVVAPTDEVDTYESPISLLCGLASSDASRMRLALIPLFLQHPRYAKYLANALSCLTPDQQQYLRCIYTAAQLLQQKYRQQLMALFGDSPTLPALFEHELGLDECAAPDVRLHQLAQQQTTLSGKAINWYGTYEHAYERLVRHAISMPYERSYPGNRL